jgi:hypothetical protein
MTHRRGFHSVSERREGSGRRRKPSKPIQRKLAGGQRHRYRINLSAGQFLKVIVEEQGIDVSVEVPIV